MAVPAPLREALSAAFVKPLSEAFLEAFGGIETTIEDLAYSNPADIEEVLWLAQVAYPGRGGR
eukprot:4229784-Amphidinium_carterae.1